jgi:hypothetical protein
MRERAHILLLLGLAIPAGVLLAGSVLLFLREKTLCGRCYSYSALAF